MPGDINSKYDSAVLLGPTATGKTRLAVRIALKYGWEIISVDSRQVYKGLDLASGKDLDEYTVDGRAVPYHLIDITTLDSEYNVFRFQNDFYAVFDTLKKEGKVPFAVGGTGLYLDSVIRGYELIPVPENEERRRALEGKSIEELSAMLRALRPNLHNKSDLLVKERAIKALEIELYRRSAEWKSLSAKAKPRPRLNPLVIGVTLRREVLYKNIERRLSERLNGGMIEEIERLHKDYSWECLEKLGLEGRYISFYLEGKIPSEAELREKLCTEIKHFAKRQETWFRKMEKSGVTIHWLPLDASYDERLACAGRLIEESFF